MTGTSLHLRRLVTAVFAAAATFSIVTPVASAAREWDIGAYDDCLTTEALEPWDNYEEMDRYCCLKTGGEWNWDASQCEAPPHPDYQRPGSPWVSPTAGTTAPFTR
jgi:hypothetical protein